MIPIFVLTTRGLEDVSQRELMLLPGIDSTAVYYRRVLATFQGDLQQLLALRTVDDVFLTAAEWRPLTHTRQALAALQHYSAELDLRPLVGKVRQVRSLGTPPSYSVTANFVGKRNYTMPEIKTAVQAGLAKAHPRWRSTDDDAAAELNVRVFMEHDTALVGVRLAARPLYRRMYKQAHLPGSLKPSVAAAILMLANANTHPEAPTTLLDPFCGSGTVLIEAALDGLSAVGGDVDHAALCSARENAADTQATLPISWARWDARRLPLKSASVDLIASNLPWGRQIQVTDSPQPQDDQPIALRGVYGGALREMRRVLKPGGRLALLTSLPHLLTDQIALEWNTLTETLTETERREISLFGQNPMLLIYTHG